MAARLNRPAAWAPLVTLGLLVAGFRPRPHGRGTSERSPLRDEAAAKSASANWKNILRRIANAISEQRILLVAAGVTFYSLLAIFPAVAALVALYGLIADPATISDQVATLAGVLPGGAVDVLRAEVDRIASQPRGTLGGAFVIGLVVSLWSANGGVKALFDALNVVYVEKETRGFVRVTAVSMAFVVGGILFVVVAMTAVVAVPIALDHIGIPSIGKSIISIARWPILLVIVALVIALIYRFGPHRTNPRWRWITWGSAFAAVAWLVMSVLFSWYAANFASYNKTYGSLGAVIGFMTWIWLSIVVILVGAETDSVLERTTTQRAPDSHRHAALSPRSASADTSSEPRSHAPKSAAAA